MKRQVGDYIFNTINEDDPAKFDAVICKQIRGKWVKLWRHSDDNLADYDDALDGLHPEFVKEVEEYMIRRLSKQNRVYETDTTISVEYSSGVFMFVIANSDLKEIRILETVDTEVENAPSKVTTLSDPAQFGTFFDNIRPELWNNEYSRAIAKCRLSDIFKIVSKSA